MTDCFADLLTEHQQQIYLGYFQFFFIKIVIKTKRKTSIVAQPFTTRSRQSRETISQVSGPRSRSEKKSGPRPEKFEYHCSKATEVYAYWVLK